MRAGRTIARFSWTILPSLSAPPAWPRRAGPRPLRVALSIAAYIKPSKEEAWARVDAIRKKIGKMSGDSTDIIREWHDNKGRYR